MIYLDYAPGKDISLPQRTEYIGEIIREKIYFPFRILQRLPAAFLRSSSILPVLECGLVAVSLDHREANSSVMKFFHEIFDYRSDQVGTFGIIQPVLNDLFRLNEIVFQSPNGVPQKEAVQQIFEKIGESLVMNLIHSSIFILRSSMISDVAEVLFDLIKFNSKVFTNIIYWF